MTGLVGSRCTKNWLLVAVLIFICTIPIALPSALPLTDLGGHLGRLSVQLDGGRTPHLAKWYNFEWYLVPNLGIDLLVEGLAPAWGLEPTVRLAVALASASTAAGILLLSRAIHGYVTPGAILALPLIYGFSFHFGFLNFNLSLGLALCLAALWVTMEQHATAVRWGTFAILCSGLWACHLVGWAIFCIIAGSRELVRQLDHEPIVDALIRTSVVMSSVLTPLVIGLLFGPANPGHGPTDMFFAWPWKLLGFLAAYRDQWQAFDLFSLFFVLFALAWMWASKVMRVDKGLALASLILSSAVVLLPHRMLGSEFADVRLIGPTLMLALIAPRPAPRLPKEALQALVIAATCFTSARIAYNSWALWERGDRLRSDLRVVASVPRGAELLTFRVKSCTGPRDWELDWRMHLSGYALARRGAFSNDQWQVPGAQLLTVHHPEVKPYMTAPAPKVGTADCGPLKDMHTVARNIPQVTTHLWVIWPSSPEPLEGWKSTSKSGESVLYVRDK